MKVQAEQALEFFLDWIGYDVGYSEHHESALAAERRERVEIESRMTDEIARLRDQVAALNEQLARVRSLARERTAVTAEPPSSSTDDQPHLGDEVASAAPAVVDDPNDSVLTFVMPTAPRVVTEDAAAKVANAPAEDKTSDESLSNNRQARNAEQSASVDGTTTSETPVAEELAESSGAPVSITMDNPNDLFADSTPEGSLTPDVASPQRSDLSAFPPETPTLGRRRRASPVRETLGLNADEGGEEANGDAPASRGADLYRSATSFIRLPSVQRPTMPSITDLEIPRMTSLVDRLVGRGRSNDQGTDELAKTAEPSVARERLEKFLRQEVDDVGAVQAPSDHDGENHDPDRESN